MARFNNVISEICKRTNRQADRQNWQTDLHTDQSTVLYRNNGHFSFIIRSDGSLFQFPFLDTSLRCEITDKREMYLPSGIFLCVNSES